MLLVLVVCLFVVFHSAASDIYSDDSQRVQSPNITDYWRAKITSFFHKFDVDNDGLVTEHEYLVLTTERARQRLGEEAGDRIHIYMTWAWNTFWCIPENDHKTVFTLEDCIASEALTVWRERPIREAGVTVDIVFHAADTDDNCEMNLGEFRKLHEIFNVPARDAKWSFDGIDADGSGSLDKREFIKAWIGYFKETEKSDKPLIFGRLTNHMSKMSAA